MKKKKAFSEGRVFNKEKWNEAFWANVKTIYVKTLKSSLHIGFPHSSDGKETTCNTGDLGLIPGLGRSSEKKKWLLTPVFLPG